MVESCMIEKGSDGDSAGEIPPIVEEFTYLLLEL